MNTPQKKMPPKKLIQAYNEDLSPDQREAKKVIHDNAITVISGRAGSGKSFLSMIAALELYATERKSGGINKIILTRPTIFKAKYNIGFLPGDEMAKYLPWVQPLRDILNTIEGVQKADEMFNSKIIEVLPMMHIQGRTFTNAFAIIDECENLDREDFVGLFTRLGKGSKMVFCGDMSQCLMQNRHEAGMPRMIEMADLVKNVGHYQLTTNFRNEIVEELLNKY